MNLVLYCLYVSSAIQRSSLRAALKAVGRLIYVSRSSLLANHFFPFPPVPSLAVPWRSSLRMTVMTTRRIAISHARWVVSCLPLTESPATRSDVPPKMAAKSSH